MFAIVTSECEQIRDDTLQFNWAGSADRMCSLSSIPSGLSWTYFLPKFFIVVRHGLDFRCHGSGIIDRHIEILVWYLLPIVDRRFNQIHHEEMLLVPHVIVSSCLLDVQIDADNKSARFECNCSSIRIRYMQLACALTRPLCLWRNHCREHTTRNVSVERACRRHGSGQAIHHHNAYFKM